MFAIQLRARVITAATAVMFLVSIPARVAAGPQAADKPPEGAAKFEKINRNVRAQAQAGELIPVFILLAHQPQAEIHERAVARHAIRLAMAQERLKRAVEMPSTSEADLALASEARNLVILDIRREAFAEIDQAIRGDQDIMESRLLGMGAQNIQRYRLLNMIAADIPSSALDNLERDEMVAEVSLVEQTGTLEVNENLTAIHVNAFWDHFPLNAPPFGALKVTGVGQTVAILDTGVSNPAAFGVGTPGGLTITGMPFLTNAARDDKDCFADNAESTLDFVNHGTNVASVIASRQAANLGVAKGLSELLNLKVGYKSNPTDGHGHPCIHSANARDVSGAIEWATADQHRVTSIFNYSHGFPAQGDYNQIAQRFDRYADAFGLAFVKAAGNRGVLTSPGTGYNVITVAAWDFAFPLDPLLPNIPAWSGRNPTDLAHGGRKKPDIAAPGVRVRVATPTGNAELSGTSLAAPHVTGALALLGQFGITNPLQAKALLINSADRPQGPAWHADSGWGYMNLENLRQQATYAHLDGNYVTRTTGYTFFVGPGQGMAANHTPTALDATLTWNRHFPKDAAACPTPCPTGFLNNLDLWAYQRDKGNFITNSVSTVDNVEFVHLMNPDDVVLKVKQNGPWQGNKQSDNFELAVALPEFKDANGPNLAITCPSGPMDLTQAWTCTIQNNGDLPAFNVTVTRNGGEMQQLQTIGAGKSKPAPWLLGTVTGDQKIDAQSNSYGEQCSATGTFTVSSANCKTIKAVPTTVMLNVPQRPPCFLPMCQAGYQNTGTMQVTTDPPGCAWTAMPIEDLPNYHGPAAWLSVSPASGIGNGTVTWTAQPFTGTINPRASGIALQLVAVPGIIGQGGTGFYQSKP